MSENAGRVTKTPIVTPMIVVIAKPFNKPAPAHIRGIIATKTVKYDQIICIGFLQLTALNTTAHDYPDHMRRTNTSLE